MRRILIIFLTSVFLCSCAETDNNGNIIYDEEGNEQIDGMKTTGLVVGTLAILTTAILIGKHSNGTSSYSGGNSYSGNCECPNDRDSNGNYCGNRSAYVRENGYNPTREYCITKENNSFESIKYRY